MNGKHQCESKATFELLCDKLGLVREGMLLDYTGSRIVGLGEPAEMGSKSVLALEGALCWFSTIHYFLVGQKTGNVNLTELYWKSGAGDNTGFYVLNKKNACDLIKLRDEIGQAARDTSLQKACLKQLQYTTIPWEIESARNFKTSIGEPWLRENITSQTEW